MNLLRCASVVSVVLGLGLGACSSTSDPPTDAGADSATPPDSSTPDSSTPDSSTPDSSTPDSSTPDSSTPDASNPLIACSPIDAGAQCNAVVNGATDVTLTTSASAIPVGIGGAVVDGRYFLTALVAYPGSALNNITSRQTLDICGGGTTGQLVNDQVAAAKRKSFTIAPTGITPNITQVCQSQAGDADIPYSSYTASVSTLSFYSTALQFSATYTRQ